MDKICLIVIGAIIGSCACQSLNKRKKCEEEKRKCENRCKKKRECILIPYAYNKCK